MKFEYTVWLDTVGLAEDDLAEKLNDFGEQGWELIAINNKTIEEWGSIYIFKKPKK